MATLSQTEHHYHDIVSRLQNTNQSWWLYTFLAGMLSCGTAVVGYMLICLVLDGLVVALPSWVRVALLVGWGAACLGALALLVVRPLANKRSVTATARRVEAAFPELRNDLINALQLTHDPLARDNPFVPMAVARAADEAGRVPLAKANLQDGGWRRFIRCVCGPKDLAVHFGVFLAVLVALVAYAAISPMSYGWALRRFFSPNEYVPKLGAAQIEHVRPGNAEVTVDSGMTVVATVKNPANESYEGALYRITHEGEERLALRPRKNHTEYVLDFHNIKAPFGYRLEIGGTETERYDVTVHARPTVGAIEATYTYPGYTGLAAKTVEQPNGDIEAPEYTLVNLAVKSPTAVDRGELHVAGDAKPTVCRVDDIDGQAGRLVQCDVLVKRNGSYTIHLFDARQYTNTSPRVNAIKAVKDKPPTVEIGKPGQNVTVAPGSTLSIVVSGGDDYGLSTIELVAVRSDGQKEMPPQVLKTWTEFADPKKVTVDYAWKLDEAVYSLGDVVHYVAIAKDNRRVSTSEGKLEPQQAQSARFQVRFSDPEKANKEALESLDKVRQRLMKILREQIGAHGVAVALKTPTTALAQSQKGGADVRQRQVTIREATVECSKVISAHDDYNRQLKQVLVNLATTPMVQAVEWAEKIATAKEQSKVGFRLERLVSLQQKIIVVLEKLLDVVRHKTNEVLKKMKGLKGHDLPQDVVQKLSDLHEKLKEFIEQQRKVIEATKNLAKKNVEDYTDEDKQMLKELAAAEDEWEKFLAEKHSDLSRVPKQDFSNPSMLDELIEIQTEIKMAKDALTKKTAEIAVPLEQLGAEMAEELATNIEKWLPDTPDREKWSQEEPLKSDMTEAPMAELPKELEDLVGELMEEEEDLFEESEDVSSSWADSLDKGAGWDTADGPISNMSARGATGNRLPNTNEIGGRSGEGRSAKSSGEFVGEEAVGKGGRRTPSRLTPDPFEKGVVKDRSRDPVGGSTGGGKESGQGGEGLEGPAPPQLNRQMKRLAKKQAELRRRGEAIDIKLRVRNYNATKWRELLEAMAKAGSDLADGKYQNAVRQRHVLIRGMRNMKQYVRGEYLIEKDRSTSLPRTTLEEILSSMDAPSPKGWDELNRKYFEKLSKDD